MFLVEVAAPAGALSADDRAMLAESVNALVRNEEGRAPEETMQRARAMTHIGFRELVDWTTGDGPWSPGDPAPIWVTVTVAEAWREEMSRPMMGALRAAVRKIDRAHGWRRMGGDVWVNLVGIADGSIGLNAKASTSDDVVTYMTEKFHAKVEQGGLDLPEGVVVDPMCGMRVTLGPEAITLEHDGGTLGFCARSCRASYARKHGLEVPA